MATPICTGGRLCACDRCCLRLVQQRREDARAEQLLEDKRVQLRAEEKKLREEVARLQTALKTATTRFNAAQLELARTFPTLYVVCQNYNGHLMELAGFAEKECADTVAKRLTTECYQRGTYWVTSRPMANVTDYDIFQGKGPAGYWKFYNPSPESVDGYFDL